MHVLDYPRTLRTLWSPCEPHRGSEPGTGSSKVRLISRVPVVRAVRLTWNRPVQVLMQNAAVEQGARSLENVSFVEVFNEGIRGVVWLTSVRTLIIRAEVQPTSRQRGVASLLLEELSFWSSFNQPVDGIAWLVSIQRLSFGIDFNQSIGGVVWPSSLLELSFGEAFNRPINDGGVGGVPATDVIWQKLQPSHRRSCLARVAAASITW